MRRNGWLIPESAARKHLDSGEYQKLENRIEKIGLVFEALNQAARQPLKDSVDQVLKQMDECEARLAEDLIDEDESLSEYDEGIQRLLPHLESLISALPVATESDKEEYAVALIEYLRRKRCAQ